MAKHSDAHNEAVKAAKAAPVETVVADVPMPTPAVLSNEKAAAAASKAEDELEVIEPAKVPDPDKAESGDGDYSVHSTEDGNVIRDYFHG